MSWSSVLGVIEKLAPTIATGLGGPLIGGAISALESVFGLTPAPTVSIEDRQTELAAAISGATPEQLAAIRSKDQDYALAMAQAGFKNTETLASLAVEDRASARAMQISTKSLTAPFLAVFVTLGFFGCLGLMMFYPIQKEAHDALMLMLGALGASWSAVVAYYFGSSQSSDRKTELLAQSTPGAQQ